MVLTKDKLLKRAWKGDTKCNLCGLGETVQHLFFDCHIARFLWNVLFIILNFQPPKDIVHLFGSWSKSFAPRLRTQVIVGVGDDVMGFVVE